MSKSRVKKLRKEFEQTIAHYTVENRLRTSLAYKNAWRVYKKDYYNKKENFQR